jgi:hypothetical protein
MLDLITWALGLFSFGGIATWVAATLGFTAGPIGWILGWFVKKGIPWRTIIIGAAALFVTLIIMLAYRHYNGLITELGDTKAALKQQELLTNFEKKRADTNLENHIRTVERISQFQEAKKAAEEEASGLRWQLDQMNIEQEFKDNAEKAAADFATRNAAINRMLERATGFERQVHKPGPAAGSKTSAPGGNAALRRTLEALRFKPVPASK